jgi:hypothetical protein
MRAARSRMQYTLAALFLACALPAQPAPRSTGEDLPNPLLVPGAPWHFDGFSVTAPVDADWASFSKDARSAELGKKYDEHRTAAAIVVSNRYDDAVVREEDLLRIVQREQSRPPDPRAMKLTSHTQESITPKGVLCGHAATRFEDRRAQYAAPGTLVVRSLTCARPDRPEILVSLRFAERFDSLTGEPALTETAERFLGGLRFLSPAGAAIAEARDAIGANRAEEAVRLLQPMADDGDMEAALFLGNIFLYGSGVAQDAASARRYLEIAAREGRVDALYNLGALYDKGIGVPRDAQQAIRWFSLAADQRDGQAQLNLALFYLRGDGVARDLREAELWLRRAAGNGSKRAQGILASGKYREQ